MGDIKYCLLISFSSELRRNTTPIKCRMSFEEMESASMTRVRNKERDLFNIVYLIYEEESTLYLEIFEFIRFMKGLGALVP
jgi:hypothetical protein